MSNAIAIIFHLLAINIWIGGTFFLVIIMPRAIVSLELAERYRLLQRIYRFYFAWVWLAILILITSGGWMVINVFGGPHSAPLYVMAMMLMALGMVTIIALVFFGPYRLFQQALQKQDLPGSERYLRYIRLLSIINMLLGIGVVVVIGAGPHFLV